MSGRGLGLGALLLVGLTAAYYAIPFFVIIISLGEICPYSPSGVSLCTKSVSTTNVERNSPGPVSVNLCKKPGIRYAGTKSRGAEVCFTLTPDRREWVEIGFRFVRASGCSDEAGETTATGVTYYEGREALTRPGQITVPGFTATIHGARAAGVLEDSKICRGKSFRWSARRAS